MSDDESSSSTQLQSPFFRASQADRYERQAQIRAYEEMTNRSLIVFHGEITDAVITPFADAVGDVHHDASLDLMLTSPGGDGETAKRMATMCHADRDDFRVIVPETAASAATLLALAAETILMTSTSVLGPVDPQIFLPLRKQHFPTKSIVELVEDLDDRTRQYPQAYVLYSALLGDIDGVAYQTAKAAIERTDELIPEVLRLRSDPPNDEDIVELTKNLQRPALHSATISHEDASSLGLPAEYVDPKSDKWNALWRLHTQYVHLLGWLYREIMIEGRRVSFRL